MGTGRDTPGACSASSGPAGGRCAAGRGWRSSSQRWAEDAGRGTEQAEVWPDREAMRGDPPPEVSVSGAGLVSPQPPRDAWWRSVSARSTQSFTPQTLQDTKDEI